MTQITRKSAPTRGLILLLAMFLGAGLVLSGCGEDDPPATPTPAPAPPPPPAPEPEPPAPEAPSVPTGLHVSATGPTFVQVSWNAVEGAAGYEIQISFDEMWTDEDLTVPVAGTSFQNPESQPIPPGTTVYVRVRAVAGEGEAALASAWSTHVTAMSDAPPPPPPALPATPMVMVSETGDDSITWSWGAVEGATSYEVQVSADGMFGEDTETQTQLETSYTVSGLAPLTSMTIRVRAIAGVGEGRLEGAWAEGVPAMSSLPPPPMAPSGLSSAAGDGSITWTWEAVEGATGYEIQVSEEEAFADDQESMAVDETTYSVDVDAGSTRYLRVRAILAVDADNVLMSAWTTHVTGSSEPPEPEPPPMPDPVMVMFSVPDDADDSYPMVPDDGTDEATAMARVNTEMTVTSNTTAIIEPMFGDGVNAVQVEPGDSWPFALLDWSVLQSTVVNDGATFKVTRVTIGANQEMEETGDVAYVTCGPFECMEGMDAPDITIANSAVCQDWDVTFDLEVGRVANRATGTAHRWTEDEALALNDVTGVDLGWVFTSNKGFTATHRVAGVTTRIAGENSAAVKATSKPTALTVPNVADVVWGSVLTDNDDAVDGNDELSACMPLVAGTQNFVNYGGFTGDAYALRQQRPGSDDGCFRVSITEDFDYLSNYEVSLAVADGSVSWGEVDWKAFADLDCEPKVYPATVDVCEMFADEVGRLGEVTAAGVVGSNILQGLNLEIERDEANERFASLWYMRSTSSSASKSYADTDDTTDDNTRDLFFNGTVSHKANSLDDDQAWWVDLIDADGDPIYGDLGIQDTAGDDAPEGFDNNADVICSEDDGGSKKSSSANDGTMCDSEQEIMTSVTFVDGLGLGCDQTVNYTLTCSWDADGGAAVGSDGTRSASPSFSQDSVEHYLECEVEVE